MAVAVGAGVVQVKYDGKTPWGAAVPYVSIDREPIFYGGKWGQVVNITLTSELTQIAYLRDQIDSGACDPSTGAGCLFLDGTPIQPTMDYPQGLKNLEKIRDDIIETFSNSLRTFEFEDTQVPPNKMEFDNAVVENIDFPAQGYWGTLSYTIALKCYEQDYFMAQGVVDAVDEFQTTENENGTLSVSHRISARGIDYTDHAGDRQHGLANAIAWVDSRKGDQYKSEEGIYKAWWGGTGAVGTDQENKGPTQENAALGSVKPINLILLNQDESINRLVGTYSVSESFIGYLDIDNNASTLPYGRKFSVDINESLTSDFNVVTITGEYVGGKDTTIKELRDGFVKDNPTGDRTLPAEPEKMLFEKAKQLSGFDGSLLVAPHPDVGANPAQPALGNYHKPLLYNIPMGLTVDEDETAKTIKIKATFDTNGLFVDDKGDPTRYFFDYKINVKMDELTNVATVSVDGQLHVRGLAAEKQFYLKEFLENRDVMDFLWQKANDQHAKIGDTCWECTGGNYPAGHSLAGQPVYGTGDYWIRADIGDLYDEAKGVCGKHPYAGSLPAGTTPERCHDLNRSAKSLSMVLNTVKNTASMSAAFSDEDTLEIKVQNPDDGTCFQCYENKHGNPPDASHPAWDKGDLVAVVFSSVATTVAGAHLLCPDGYDSPANEYGAKAFECDPSLINTINPNPLIGMLKDYGRASFNVDITSPIDFARTNPSAQAKYNGHWAIQKFGIKTREKSNVKVDLQFREDAGVPSRLMESALRKQAKDIQDALNGMLDQGGGAAQGVSPVYDISERVAHKESKGDKVTHSLQRSYAPDADHTICVDIDPIGHQKDCFVCVDPSGDIAVSPTMGDKVYAYPESVASTTLPPATPGTSTTMPPVASNPVAQQLCDQIGLSIGIDPVVGIGLTPRDCGGCYKCVDGYSVIHKEVYAESQGEAGNMCSGTGPGTTSAPSTTANPLKAVLAWPCDKSLPTICYQCIHQAPTPTSPAGAAAPPPTILYPPAGGFDTFSPHAAEAYCYVESTGDTPFTWDATDAEYTVRECPDLEDHCWTCYKASDGTIFGFVMAAGTGAVGETNAKNECSIITGFGSPGAPTVSGPLSPTPGLPPGSITVGQPCDFDALTTPPPATPTTTTT